MTGTTAPTPPQRRPAIRAVSVDEADAAIGRLLAIAMPATRAKPGWLASHAGSTRTHASRRLRTSPSAMYVSCSSRSDSTSCGGVFGIPVVDTTGGSFKVYYFAINDEKAGKDYYEETLKCFTEKGVSSCYDLPSVVKWADVPF